VNLPKDFYNPVAKGFAAGFFLAVQKEVLGKRRGTRNYVFLPIYNKTASKTKILDCSG
jgi:hypothetical protein